MNATASFVDKVTASDRRRPPIGAIVIPHAAGRAARGGYHSPFPEAHRRSRGILGGHRFSDRRAHVPSGETILIDDGLRPFPLMASFTAGRSAASSPEHSVLARSPPSTCRPYEPPKPRQSTTQTVSSVH